VFLLVLEKVVADIVVLLYVEAGDGRFTWTEAPETWADRERARRVLGSIHVTGRRLALDCLFADRLAEGRTLLETVCGTWLSDPFESSDPLWSSLPPETEDLTAVDLRAWVDTPLPSLDGLTPRQAAALHRGRRQLDNLLASFERGHGGTAELTWVRHELGIKKK
jgi:hypothetical protein